TDDELTDKEVKQMEADDQAIQTILMGLSENIYVAVDSYYLHATTNTKQQLHPTTIIQPELHATTNVKSQDISDPTTAINMALVLMAKAFKLNYSTPTNNNQRISSNPCNRQIAQPGMNIGQDRQMQMVGECRESEGKSKGKGNVCLAARLKVMEKGTTELSSVEQSGGTVEQNPATVEETRALYDSLYNNLAI
ncbi:hypothetical protein Tco_1233895, partial [Tanacetum coccineum]